jgi:aspartate racemase
MHKPVYVLGGMGPQASIELYRLIIEYAEKHYAAERNNDYPEIILHSIPVPDFISDESSRAEALGMLKRTVREMPSQTSAFAIACNTAHILAPELQMQTRIPFLSMIDSVVQEIDSQGIGKVGLMATPSTIRSLLYQVELAKRGIEVIEPLDSELKVIETSIRSILANNSPHLFRRELEEIIKNLKRRGAEVVVLGCTELPVILKQEDDIISSTNCLARSIVDRYFNKNV